MNILKSMFYQIDSTSLRSELFNGIATDDYGVSEIALVYYGANQPDEKQSSN